MKRKVDHIDINKHLAHQELLDYSDRVLGSEEMYRIELHLNECALCSDALDGLELIQRPEKIIQSINNELLPKQEMSIPKRYLAMAASFLLISALGITFWLVNSNNKSNYLVDNEVEKPDQAQVNSSEKLEQPLEEQNDKMDSTSDDPQTTTIYSQNGKEEPTYQDKTETETVKTKAAEISPELVAGAGQVEEEQVMEEEEPKEIQDNTLAIIDIAEQEEDLDLALDSNPVLDERKENVAPAAVLSQAEKSTVTRSKKVASRQMKETPVDRKQPEPVGGMSNYKNYLLSDIIYPKQAQELKIKGTVVLRVTIGTNGTVNNIVVLKSIGHGCDEEAIRLINEGPNWQPAIVDGIPIETVREIKIKFKL